MTQDQVNKRAFARMGELARQIKAVIYSRKLKRLQTVIEQLTSPERAIFEQHLQGPKLDIYEKDQSAANAAFEANFAALTALFYELVENYKGTKEAELMRKNGGAF